LILNEALKANTSIRMATTDTKCKYCHFNGFDGPNIFYDDYATDMFHLIHDSKGVWLIGCYADQSSQIYYCPMCSRKLDD
jgi:hypothetical protein